MHNDRTSFGDIVPSSVTFARRTRPKATASGGRGGGGGRGRRGDPLSQAQAELSNSALPVVVGMQVRGVTRTVADTVPPRLLEPVTAVQLEIVY